MTNLHNSYHRRKPRLSVLTAAMCLLLFAGSVQAPRVAHDLMSTLQDKSPSNASRGKS
jgi:hypothetical protein